MSVKASILAIGTEITTGEIQNSNASIISSSLVDLGYEIVAQLAVPDDRNLIQSALTFLTSASSVLIVTGGLGPTSDDFTRDEICKFAGKTLIWDEPSWQRICERLTALNAASSESNRQQCWYPEGSEILVNHHGTASGFRLKSHSSEIIVLPGPPREIDGIWQDGLRDSLQLSTHENVELKLWHCLGLSEAKLGEFVDQVMLPTGLTTGFRVNLPYVDVKIWVPASRGQEFTESVAPKLEQAIGKWVVGRDKEDIAVKLTEIVPPTRELLIIDRSTCGKIASRIHKTNPSRKSTKISVVTTSATTLFSSGPADVISVEVASDLSTGSFHMVYRDRDICHSVDEKSVYKGSRLAERHQLYVCEKALIKICELLQSTPNSSKL